MVNGCDAIEAEIPRLTRYARSLTRNLDGADDLVQECLARALENQARFAAGTNLGAWLFTILHNEHVNRVRRLSRRRRAQGAVNAHFARATLPRQVDRLELLDLERAVKLLPEDQRLVVLLSAHDGMPYHEIAAVLGIPIGTVRSRLSRARETLRLLTGAAPKEAWRVERAEA